MSVILAIVALLAPIWLSLLAYVLTKQFGFWWMFAAVTLAGLASLPLGFVLRLIAEQPLILTSPDRVSPGIGVVGLGVVFVWVVSFTIIAAWLIGIAVKKALRKTAQS